ncbi:MAG: hypothetical protein NWE92_03840 [Candidatus Bathyarchaeota archaeon]|nr:hypothetical protein [Candidatus Bathyarchaeota archaeon]
MSLFLLISVATFVAPLKYASATPPVLQWENTYGYLNGVMAIQTSDQGYAIVGTRADFVASIEPYTNHSATLIKTDSAGKLEWQKNYVTQTGGNPQLIIDSNGRYVLSGSQNPAVDSSGANAVFQTVDGGYVVAGTETWVYNFGQGGVIITNGKLTVFFLLKTDADGNVLWHKTYNPGNGGNYSFIIPINAALSQVIATSDGGYLLAGTLNSGEFGWVVKVDASGKEQWQKIYRFGQNDTYAQIYYAEQTPDGYLLAGSLGGYYLFKLNSEGDLTYVNHLTDSRSYFSTFFKGHDDAYLWVGFARVENQSVGSILFVNADDNVIANKTYPDTSPFNLGAPTADGGYLMVQTQPLSFLPTFSSINTTLAKLDANNNVEWRQTYGETLDLTRALFPTSDGGFGLVGTRLEGYYTWKYDSTTYKQWIFLSKTAPLTASPTSSPTVPEITPCYLALLAVAVAAVALASKKIRHVPLCGEVNS